VHLAASGSSPFIYPASEARAGCEYISFAIGHYQVT